MLLSPLYFLPAASLILRHCVKPHWCPKVVFVTCLSAAAPCQEVDGAFKNNSPLPNQSRQTGHLAQTGDRHVCCSQSSQCLVSVADLHPQAHRDSSSSPLSHPICSLLATWHRQSTEPSATVYYCLLPAVETTFFCLLWRFLYNPIYYPNSISAADIQRV